MKNYELNLLASYAAVVSLNIILLAVSLYRLIYLLIMIPCSSFVFNFSPDIICAYPFVFLNPLELKATPAKERIVFLFILIYCTQTENVPIDLSARMTRVSIC